MVRVETVAELVAVLQKVSQWQKRGDIPHSQNCGWAEAERPQLEVDTVAVDV